MDVRRMTCPGRVGRASGHSNKWWTGDTGRVGRASGLSNKWWTGDTNFKYRQFFADVR